MISFNNVNKFILSGITFQIPAGISVGIIGATGAGKTTLLKLACGLLKADKGEVYIDGNNQKDYSKKIANYIGVLFTDKPIFNAEESVRENFETIKSIYRIENDDFAMSYKNLSARLGFDKYDNEKVKNLSLGQRRRAEIGAILIHNPRFIIMDEPTNGLDENAKKVFRDILQEYAENGATVLISSHDLASISNICKRIAVIDKGMLLYYGGEGLLIKKFVPIDIMSLKLDGEYPDFEDMPLECYYIEDENVTLIYNSNHISSAEILENIVAQVKIKEVSIRKPDLADAILKIQSQKGNEYE